MLNGKTILLTGGTGSFGKKFVQRVFAQYNPKKIIIYSRDEYKQYVMRQTFKEYDDRLRYFIGDVRDQERLYRAFDQVDYVIHAAALKQVPTCEYNPFEAVKTNINGAEHIINAAIDKGVKRVVALSTDKAVNPINLYGATKLASDKIFVSANAYGAHSGTVFSVVRYGNVSGSRGSVIPFFKMLIDKGEKELPITDFRMTRFWITLDEAVDLVFKALDISKGGEIYVSKIPSFKITDLAKAMLPGVKLKEVGIREGEKLHEVMVTEYDSLSTYEYDDYYAIYPNFEWWNFKKHFTPGGKKVAEFFYYDSLDNKEYLSVEELQKRLKQIDIVY
ncbi:MAG: UDP-N-acetylglucosamine 4,6-dehydratase (inverting) [Calditrichales bacterium]|nr:MAG: UDP-N-acetylglucosamine 4,6-dehydratase (inverting) [Calditrichales bacterium]